MGLLAFLVRVVTKATVVVPVADPPWREAEATGTAKVGGQAGARGATVLVGAIGTVGDAIAAPGPGQAVPIGAAVPGWGAARGAGGLVRAVAAVILVVTEPGARHAAPIGTAPELPCGAAW